MTSIPFQQTVFQTSAATLNQAPADDGLEVAFCGRSNAGKSSALNHNAAKATRKNKSDAWPYTTLIFSLSVRISGWSTCPVMAMRRCRNRSSNFGNAFGRLSARSQEFSWTYLLVDSRHPPKPFDLAMMEWANTADLQLHVLLTKADKLSKNQGQQALFKFRQSTRGTLSSQLFQPQWSWPARAD